MEITVIFGSNTGDRQKTIEKAEALLSERAGILLKSSCYYETEPWGFECNDSFLNRIASFDTSLSPQEFLDICLKVEQELGRIRLDGVRYQSRTIDIDLLFCGSLSLNTPRLVVPHPRLAERNFVLVPLCEIMPDFIHPVLRKSIRQLLDICPDTCKVVCRTQLSGK